MNFADMPQDVKLSEQIYAYVLANKRFVENFVRTTAYSGKIDIEITEHPSGLRCVTMTREQMKDVYSVLRVKGLL